MEGRLVATDFRRRKAATEFVSIVERLYPKNVTVPKAGKEVAAKKM